MIAKTFGNFTLDSPIVIACNSKEFQEEFEESTFYMFKRMVEEHKDFVIKHLRRVK